MKYCKYCNKKLDEDMKFCTECGIKIDENSVIEKDVDEDVLNDLQAKEGQLREKSEFEKEIDEFKKSRSNFNSENPEYFIKIDKPAEKSSVNSASGYGSQSMYYFNQYNNAPAKKSCLPILGLVFSGVSVLFFLIPFLNLIFAITGFILSLIGLIKNKSQSKSLEIAAMVVSALVFFGTVFISVVFSIGIFVIQEPYYYEDEYYYMEQILQNIKYAVL